MLDVSIVTTHLGTMGYIFDDKVFLKALQFFFSQDISKKLFRKKKSMCLLEHNKKHFILGKLECEVGVLGFKSILSLPGRNVDIFFNRLFILRLSWKLESLP